MFQEILNFLIINRDKKSSSLVNTDLIKVFSFMARLEAGVLAIGKFVANRLSGVFNWLKDKATSLFTRNPTAHKSYDSDSDKYQDVKHNKEYKNDAKPAFMPSFNGLVTAVKSYPFLDNNVVANKPLPESNISLSLD